MSAPLTPQPSAAQTGRVWRYLLEAQEPFCTLIVEGRKTVETRAYPCPAYLMGNTTTNQRIELFATLQGKAGVSALPDAVSGSDQWGSGGGNGANGGSTPQAPQQAQQQIPQVLGSVAVAACFRYASKKAFDDDFARHLVDPNGGYGWEARGGLIWGWVLERPRADAKTSDVPRSMRRVFRSIFRAGGEEAAEEAAEEAGHGAGSSASLRTRGLRTAAPPAAASSCTPPSCEPPPQSTTDVTTTNATKPKLPPPSPPTWTRDPRIDPRIRRVFGAMGTAPPPGPSPTTRQQALEDAASPAGRRQVLGMTAALGRPPFALSEDAAPRDGLDISERTFVSAPSGNTVSVQLIKPSSTRCSCSASCCSCSISPIATVVYLHGGGMVRSFARQPCMCFITSTAVSIPLYLARPVVPCVCSSVHWK